MLHSWSWIAARLSPRRIWSGSHSLPHRPCIASVEPLDDRILLSADAVVEGPPRGDAAVLAAAMKGELNLVVSEQNLLTLAGNGLTDQTIGDFKHLTDAIAKVNDATTLAAADIFAKLGDIKGESLDDKHKDEIEVLSFNFNKIEVAYKALAGVSENALLPAVQFEADALGLVKLLQSSTGGNLDQKTEVLFSNILDQSNTLDNTIIKVQSDLITHRKAGKGQQEYLVVKLNDVLVTSINRISDTDLKAQLLGIESQAIGILDGLLKIDTGGGGGGGGGDIIG
jgi:type VI protein secretion system component Hcp